MDISLVLQAAGAAAILLSGVPFALSSGHDGNHPSERPAPAPARPAQATTLPAAGTVEMVIAVGDHAVDTVRVRLPDGPLADALKANPGGRLVAQVPEGLGLRAEARPFRSSGRA